MLGRAAAGGVMLVGVRLLTRFSDLITMLVLARVLDPRSFGIVAIALSIVTIFETALELPLHNVLLRHSTLKPSFFDTAFTLSLARGAIIGSFLFAISVPFANFYHNSRLAALVCVLSLAPVFRGLISPKLAVYQRELSFWRDFIIEATGKAVASAAAISMALLTHSYWAIAIGTIIYPIGMTITSYVLAPYRPRISLVRLKYFLDFLGWNSAAQIVSAINWQCERLLLGRLQSPSQLGLFSTGNDVASIPFMAVFGPILRPLYAAFARTHDDRRALRRTYESASAALLTFGLPLLIGESCLAEPTVRLILGPKWLAAAPLVRWLSLSFIPALFAMSAAPLFMAVGDTKLLFRRNMVEFLVKLPLVTIGAIRLGFAGVIAARIISEVVAATFCLFTVHGLIGLAFRDQLLAGWRSIVSSLLMAAVILWGRSLIAHTAFFHSLFAELALLVPLGGLTYGGGLVLLWAISGRPSGVEAMMLAALRRFASERSVALRRTSA